MPLLAAGNTVYTHPVAKVMISIPDDLLGRLDARARANQETRSGFLQRLAEREIEMAGRDMRTEVDRLMDSLDIVVPEGHPAGSDIARVIRADSCVPDLVDTCAERWLLCRLPRTG